MIGITFALPSESSEFRKQLSSAEREGELIVGTIAHHQVALVHTGVGAKHCNARLELLLHKTRPRLVISAGFAGAARSQLSNGDLILAQNFSDPQLLARAERILAPRGIRPVKFFTTNAIVDSVKERTEIARVSGAEAIEMETETIAKVCRAHGAPMLSLRVISDTPHEPFPAPPTVLFDIQRQQTSYLKLARYFLVHPRAIPALLRFSRRIAVARQTLTGAIVTLVQEL